MRRGGAKKRSLGDLRRLRKDSMDGGEAGAADVYGLTRQSSFLRSPSTASLSSGADPPRRAIVACLRCE